MGMHGSTVPQHVYTQNNRKKKTKRDRQTKKERKKETVFIFVFVFGKRMIFSGNGIRRRRGGAKLLLLLISARVTTSSVFLSISYLNQKEGRKERTTMAVLTRTRTERVFDFCS